MGTNSNELNPANVVDTRHKVFINLAGVGFDFQNNAARWKAPFSLLGFMTQNVKDEYKNASGEKILWKTSYIDVTNANKLKMHANFVVRGPAIGLDLTKIGWGFAAGVKYKYLTSITNATPFIGQAIIEGTKSPNLNNKKITGNVANVNSGFYNEFFFTLGKTILTDDERFMKIGASFKYLNSDLFMNIKANDLDFGIQTDPGNVKKQIINLPKTDGQVSLASNFLPLSSDLFVNQLTQITGLGKGLGLDLGFVYEYRPDANTFTRKNNGKTFIDPTKNKYEYKLGISLIDVGFIKFSSPSNVKVSEINSTNDQILPGTFNKIKSYDELIGSISGVYGVDNRLDKHSFTLFTPAMTVITFDYKINTRWYLSSIWRQSVLSAKRRGYIGYSGISIIPRFEKKLVEVAIPLSLDNSYRNLNLGFSCRVAGLYFGFDNITGWLNTFNPRGLSVYSGLFVPIYHRMPKSPLKCNFEDNPTKYRRKRFKK